MGYLALGGLLRRQFQLSSLKPGPPNPSGRQASGNTMASKRAEACTADDKQASKKVEACSAEHPNPIFPLVSAKLDGANDGGCANAGSEFVKGFALVLTQMTLVANRQTHKKATIFHSASTPSLSIKDYLYRIRKYFRCSDECFVLALVYIDRVAKADSAMAVTALNAHRLLLTAVVLAAKFQDDVHYCNAYYAKVGGLTLQEVNSLEKHFVKALSWELYVGPEEYTFYHNVVCEATTCAHVPSHVPVQVQVKPDNEPEPTICGQCGHVKPGCVCESLTSI